MKAVSDPWLREDIPGLVGFRLDLSTQLLYKNPQILHFVAVIRSPDRLEKFPVRNGFIGVKHQIAEQFELFWGEAHFATAHNEFPGLKVYFNVFEGDPLRTRFWR